MWINVLSSLQLLKADRKGIASLEWAILAAFILIGLIAALPAFLTALQAVFNNIATAINGA